MDTFSYNDKAYEVDSRKFLKDFEAWDENFADGMALQLQIPHGLTKEHWDIIHFIHDAFKETGRCPMVYETCQKSGLRLKDLKRLFPTGYLRGACKLAGISSKAGHLGPTYHPASLPQNVSFMESYDKSYEVDVRGFLINHDQWDDHYAIYRAYDMKINGGKLTTRHWQIIRFLREQYEKSKEVPTIYETCEANGMDLNEIERLFPDGYHRGAVKIAGLRVG